MDFLCYPIKLKAAHLWVAFFLTKLLREVG